MALQVSPLSATRLTSLVDSRKSKKEEEETNLEISTADKEGRQGLEPKDYLMTNLLPMTHASNPPSYEPCSQRLESDLLNQPKCENVREDSECEIVQCSSERTALLLRKCENGKRRMPPHHSQEGPSRNCEVERPGRFEMLI